MSRKRSTVMEKLIAKRAAIDADIAAAEAAEKRKSEILAMPEFTAILHLDDSILRTAFQQIGTENRTSPQSAQR